MPTVKTLFKKMPRIRDLPRHCSAARVCARACMHYYADEVAPPRARVPREIP